MWRLPEPEIMACGNFRWAIEVFTKDLTRDGLSVHYEKDPSKCICVFRSAAGKARLVWIIKIA